MKKKLIIFCFVAVATVSAVLYVQSKSNLQDDLLLANVEALADVEATGPICRNGMLTVCDPEHDKSCYFWIINDLGEDLKCFFPNYQNII